MPNEITIKVKGDDQASGVFRDVKGHAEGLGSKLGNVAQIASGFVIGTGVMKLGGFLMDAANAAAADEQSMLRLKTAVTNTGVSFETYAGALSESISAAQRHAFTDDAARDSLSLLMAQTGDTDEAMRRFALAQDLARGAGIPLEQASKLLGKVSEENTEVFKKLGITIGEGATEADVFAEVQKKFAGQSEAYANSTAGQFEQTKIAMGELKERIGAQLLPVMASLGKTLVEDVIPALNKAADWIELHIKPAVEEFVQSEVIPMLNDAFAQLKQTIDGLTPTAEAIFKWLKENPAAIAVLTGALVGLAAVLFPVPAAIAAIVVGGTLLLAHWDDIREAVTNLVADFKEKFPEIWIVIETVFDLIKNHVETIFNAIKDFVQIWIAVFKGDWDKAWSEVKQLFTGILDGMLDHVTIILGGVVDLFLNLGPRILEAVGDLLTLLYEQGANIIKGLFNGMWAAQGAVWAWLSGIPGFIKGLFGDAVRLLWNIGFDIIQGLWDGLQDKWKSVVGWFEGLPGKITGFLKDPLGIFSPSKVMAEIGKNIIAGLEQGVKDVGSLTVTLQQLTVMLAQAVDSTAAGVIERARVNVMAQIAAINASINQGFAGLDIVNGAGAGGSGGGGGSFFSGDPGMGVGPIGGSAHLGGLDAHELSAIAWALFADPSNTNRNFSSFNRSLDAENLGIGNLAARLSLAQLRGVDVRKIWSNWIAARPGLASVFSIEGLLADLLPYGFRTAHTGFSGTLTRDTIFSARAGEHVRVTPGGGGGTGTVNITINALDGESVRRVVPDIARELQRFMRTQGAVGMV